MNDKNYFFDELEKGQCQKMETVIDTDDGIVSISQNVCKVDENKLRVDGPFEKYDVIRENGEIKVER
jgi:hypothetical protein